MYRAFYHKALYPASGNFRKSEGFYGGGVRINLPKYRLNKMEIPLDKSRRLCYDSNSQIVRKFRRA